MDGRQIKYINVDTEKITNLQGEEENIYGEVIGRSQPQERQTNRPTQSTDAWFKEAYYKVDDEYQTLDDENDRLKNEIEILKERLAILEHPKNQPIDDLIDEIEL